MASVLVCLLSAHEYPFATLASCHCEHVKTIYGITKEVVVSSPVDIETCTERLDLAVVTGPNGYGPSRC